MRVRDIRTEWQTRGDGEGSGEGSEARARARRVKATGPKFRKIRKIPRGRWWALRRPSLMFSTPGATPPPPARGPPAPARPGAVRPAAGRPDRTTLDFGRPGPAVARLPGRGPGPSGRGLSSGLLASWSSSCGRRYREAEGDGRRGPGGRRRACRRSCASRSRIAGLRSRRLVLLARLVPSEGAVRGSVYPCVSGVSGAPRGGPPADAVGAMPGAFSGRLKAVSRVNRRTMPLGMRTVLRRMSPSLASRRVAVRAV